MSFSCQETSQIPITVSSQLAEDTNPEVLTEIYEESINIALWKRQLAPSIRQEAAAFIAANPNFQASLTAGPETALQSIIETFGDYLSVRELAEDIAQLVEMYCCLFDLKRVGLRLTVLNNAMCPKFHVDRVPCRLVTTYHGDATQWLPNALADRSKLELGSKGLSDSESGLFNHSQDIRQLTAGDVALLKGEEWEGNEGLGLIHRSPSINKPRLLVTLDFSD